MYNEVPILQIGLFTATQSNFSKLRRCEWLNDNIIDMFLRRYVQEMTTGTFYFTTHFMEEMLKEEDASDIYDHEKVQHWADGIKGVCSS